MRWWCKAVLLRPVRDSCGALGLRLQSAGDRGAASIFVLAVGLVMVVAGSSGAAVGAARAARHEARTAADLGALAGAMRAVEGGAAACARAAEVVGANGSRMTSCRLEGLEIVVEVSRQIRLPAYRGHAGAVARAGPVTG